MDPNDPNKFPIQATSSATCPTTISGSSTQGGGLQGILNPIDMMSLSPGDTRTGSMATSKEEEDDSSNAASSDCKSPGQRYVNFFSIILF